MTRNECFLAISNVYGARAEAFDECWKINIYTEPRREIILDKDFVTRNIDTENMSQNEFENILRVIPLTSDRWVHPQPDGILCLTSAIFDVVLAELERPR
jgi:hypothetical protein